MTLKETYLYAFFISDILQLIKNISSEYSMDVVIMTSPLSSSWPFIIRFKFETQMHQIMIMRMIGWHGFDHKC